ncbi:MAG: adenylate/guanylate cyclase domain-containing protein [Proteobacteria bacterium]|nr:adenylate/guanylate cyclase domain-containing protein [Pseudomonadota bacterium]
MFLKVLGLRERETVKSAFARYVSHQVMDAVLSSGSAPTLAGERRKVTVLFSDIRGFTTAAEKLAPEVVVELLNQYFERMVEVIFKHGGTLDKFIGDGVMVIFGAPAEDNHQEEHAVRAALEMLKEVAALSAQWQKAYGFELKIGIGINTGSAIVGNIGSTKRLEYTAIGDTVNLASRLQAATKEQNTALLFSDFTHSGIRGVIASERLGAITIRGKSEPVTVYTAGASSEAQSNSLKDSNSQIS